ncbi:MAG: HEPN domain-containing protein [Bacteroidetes bacterium]|nr:HEPN domain-containing protein [Bacteroidota bacterium]
MNTTLPASLPGHKQAEIGAIKGALIPRFGEIEMIILFGSYARGRYVEDVYTENGNTYEYKSDYDLLIVLSKNAQAGSDTLTQAITKRLRELELSAPVHPIYHGVDFVNQELREGNYFFGDIKKEGILLFTTNRYQLADKRELSPQELQAKAQRDFDHWFNSANEFFDSFQEDLKKEKWKVAAFLLHQATERYYGAIQLVFTGYKPKTHDIEDLGALAKACDLEFDKVFPKASKPEHDRFELLRKAYVDARYNMDYAITREDLLYLAERVLLLRKLTQEICTQKIKGFSD